MGRIWTLASPDFSGLSHPEALFRWVWGALPTGQVVLSAHRKKTTWVALQTVYREAHWANGKVGDVTSLFCLSCISHPSLGTAPGQNKPLPHVRATTQHWALSSLCVILHNRYYRHFPFPCHEETEAQRDSDLTKDT